MRTGVLADHRLDDNGMGAKVAELLDDQNMDRFAPTKILEGLNDAIAEFCVRTRCKFDGVDVEFAGGERDYNVITFIDAGGNAELGFIARIGRYDGTAQDFPYELLRGEHLFKLDRMGVTTHGDGQPERWHNDMVDYHEISVLPVPTDDFDAGPPKNHGAYVLYVAIATLMTYAAPNFDNLDDELPTLALLPICHGAAGYILEYGGMAEIEKAQEHFAKFEKGIADFLGGYTLAHTDYGSTGVL